MGAHSWRMHRSQRYMRGHVTLEFNIQLVRRKTTFRGETAADIF